MTFAEADLDALAKHFYDYDYIPSGDPNNPAWALRTFLPGLYRAVLDARDAAKVAAAKTVDVDALAAAVVAKLPAAQSAILDPAVLKQAVKDALKEGVG